jgi:hypothetical protein
MAVFAWALIAVVGGALFVFSCVAAASGCLAAIDALTGARWRRCPRCHRYGLVVQGQVHRGGCPHGIRQHLAPLHVLPHHAVR